MSLLNTLIKDSLDIAPLASDLKEIIDNMEKECSWGEHLRNLAIIWQ